MTNYKSDVAIFSRASSIPSQAKAPYLGCLICNPALLLILLLIKFSSSSPSSSSSSSSSSLPPHHYHHNYFSLLILPSFPLPHYRLLYLLLFPQSLLVGWLSFFPSRLPPPYSFLLYFLIFYQYIHQLIFLLPPHPFLVLLLILFLVLSSFSLPLSPFFCYSSLLLSRLLILLLLLLIETRQSKVR